MKHAFVTAALAAICSATLSADVTIKQTMTMEGGVAAAMAGKMPQMVTRIKGTKARTDIDVMDQTISSITDLTVKEVVLLQSASKRAQVMTFGSTLPGASTMTMPKIDFSVKPTGQSRTIEAMSCEEHSIAMTMDMAGFSGATLPPEAQEMMKDVRIVANGSLWVTKTGPGVPEFVAFQKAALDSNLTAGFASMFPGGQSGMNKLIAAAATISGVPCLTEFTMVFEGTGPMVDAMKQAGPMKMVQKTTSISLDPVSDDLFKIPADYKVEKK